MTKIKKEREQHLKIVEFHTAKSQEHEIEIEQQILRTKIAKESDAVSRNKCSQLKKTYHNLGKDHKKANETIQGLKGVMNSMERAANQQKATITGLRTRTVDQTQSNKTDEQLVELLHLKEILLGEKDKEALEMKERITKFETDSEASERLHASQERSTSTMRTEI